MVDPVVRWFAGVVLGGCLVLGCCVIVAGMAIADAIREPHTVDVKGVAE